MVEANKHIFFKHLLDPMRLIYAVFIILLVLITSAQCVIRLDSNDAESWSNKGSALGEQGKYDEAIKAFDEAIRLDPKLATAWYNKGIALVKQDKYDEAIKCFDEVTKLDPKHADAWYNKGTALKLLGRTTEANAAFTKAKELGYSG